MTIKFYKNQYDDWVFSYLGDVIIMPVSNEVMDKLSKILGKDVIYIKLTMYAPVEDDENELYFYYNNHGVLVFSGGLKLLCNILCNLYIRGCNKPPQISIKPWQAIKIKDIH